MNRQILQLAPPSPATRQTAIGIPTSPIPLSRSTTSSSTENLTPEESIRRHLFTFKVHLEHDIEFVSSEIRAITEQNYDDRLSQESLLTLRDNLKVRYNTLQKRLTKVNALLEVL